MSALVEKGKPAEDLGAILARVQDDLQLLRTTVARASDGGAVDVSTLDSVLTRTERGVQAASEQVLSSELDHVTTLPPVYGASKGDEGRRTRGERSRRTQSEGRGDLLEMAELSSRHCPINQARVSHMSTGEQCQAVHRARLLMQPSLPATRKLLSEQYSLPLTTDVRIPQRTKVTGKVYSGGTVSRLTTLPKMTPPFISEEDAQRGLLSLIERQLIPPAADIILNPPPVKSKPLELLTPSQQFTRPRVAMEEDVCGHVVGVRLAPDHMTVTPAEHYRPTTPASTPATTIHTLEPAHVTVPMVQPPPLPDHPTQVECVTSLSPPSSADLKISIENGRTLTTSEAYHQLELSQPQRWNDVLSVVGKLETLCLEYAVPMATVHCGRLVELACDHSLGLRIRRQELLSCLINGDDVKRLLAQPGQRYRGERGRHAAATKIQAQYRMYHQRFVYLHHLRRCWAVGVISTAWTLFIKRYQVRVGLSERRIREMAAHRTRLVSLGKRWCDVQQGKRVIIHLPSLGHPLCVRGTETQLNMEQSLQLARIADTRDPNVEVVYISSVEVDQEIVDYYTRLLGMGQSGSHRGMERVHIITPDHLHTFPSHPLPLSSLLALSPRTIHRIKRLAAGREAYIVPGVVNNDDMTISDMLDIPLLGPDPETTRLYSSKDGARKLFSSANVATPPYVTDVFSETQLLEQLAGLVAGHPSIGRWIFKLPSQTRGRGFAYCNISDHLQCYQWLVRESKRYGDKWSSRWAKEQALQRISSELPSILSSHATPVDSDLYPTWRAFLADFLVRGGLIEGHPPSTSITALTVDMIIEPDGNIGILSTQDQVCPHPYKVWGVSVPQSSVSPQTLLSSAQKVGVACRERGIIGHLSIDYVTFVDPDTLTQVLWAVDLDLGYSNHLALQQLLGYVSGATMDPASGQLMVQGSPRFAILSPRVYHTNLPVIQYPVFFQMCKAHHIGYDTKEDVGTVFVLLDREHKEHVGIICLQSSLASALSSCSTSLSTIHQEISTPLMQGRSNFKAVCKELEMVATLVLENSAEEDKAPLTGNTTHKS